MNNETKHTPWIMEYGSEESAIIDARGYIICTNGEDPSVVSDDEMTHIVKCVNMHDELVDKMENILIAIGMGWDLEGVAEEAAETLKKAGAL